MLFNLTSVLTACTLISCVTLIAVDEDTKRPGRGNSSPFSVANGSNGGGSPGHNGSGGDDTGGADSGSGSNDYGLIGDRWQDRVPREPMWYIPCGGLVYDNPVHPEDNYRGYAHWWRGEGAVERFIGRIQTGYDVGARWFFINRPMGAPRTTHVPGASWLTLDHDRRDDIPKLLTDALLDRFDEPVHVVWFIGSEMSDPRSFPGWTPGRTDDFYAVGADENWHQLISSRVTLGGWISTGASGIAIDDSSPLAEREHFMRLFESFNGFPFHLMIYGETYPLDFESDGRYLRGGFGKPTFDQHAIETMPWIATTNFLDLNWPLDSQSDVFPVDPDKTRMFVWLEHSNLRYGSDSDRVQLVNAYMDRNQIPITNDPLMFTEAINRLRSSHSSARAPGGGSDQQSGSGNPSSGSTRARSHRASGSGAASGSEGGSTQAQAGQGSTKANLPKRYTRSKRKQK